MISVENAINIITNEATQLKDEKISIDKCLGRITSINIYANINNPPKNVSSMDGYALSLASLKSLNSLPIKIIGESAAGKPFNKTVKNNECIEIYTGAEIPKGLDIILLQERVKLNNGYIVSTDQNYKQSQYIRKKGSNFKKGSLLLKKNNIVTARALGLIISSDHTHIKVFKKLKIAILASGNELRKAGSIYKNGIVSSNTLLLKSVIESFGGETYDLGIARDNSSSIMRKLEQITKYNILITTGGASVGKHDLIKKVLENLGMKTIFWKVAMRPGKPLIFGKLKKTLILGFPGNPVSTYVSALIFLKPLINKYNKIINNNEYKYGILDKPLIKNDERQEYLRSEVYLKDNKYFLTPVSAQDSSMTSSLSRAQGLIIRKPFARALNKGNKVLFILFSDMHTLI
jgi:molybdopterin molybdotransferase